MNRFLKEPLLKDSWLLNSPANLLGVLLLSIGGWYIYLIGYTYEGFMAAVFGAFSLFFSPYYHRIFKPEMTYIIISFILPVSVLLQNKACEAGCWYYDKSHMYLLGWITEEGEGPFNITQVLWLGNDMPTMEYVFYPLLCFTIMSWYCFLTYILPDKPFEKVSKYFKWLPWFFFGVAGFSFLIPILFPNPHTNIDYGYYFALLGQVMGIYFYISEPNFRKWLTSLAAFIWVIMISFIFLPVWEFVESILNSDWIYDTSKTTKAIYCFNGNCLPMYEVVGYLGVPIVFLGMYFKIIKLFGEKVIKNYDYFPFSEDD